MAAVTTSNWYYSPKVAARTNAAEIILNSSHLMAAYEAGGGRRAELHAVLEHGLAAERANLGQSDATAIAKNATATALTTFEAVRDEYNDVMTAVRGAKWDLANEGASTLTLDRIEKILKNEVPARLVIAGPEGMKRKMKKSESYAAIAGEIVKDSLALIALTEAHAALAGRNVPVQRLDALAQAATEFRTQSSDTKTATRSQKQAATKLESASAKAQSDAWTVAYRFLVKAGRLEPQIALLLQQATKAR